MKKNAYNKKNNMKRKKGTRKEKKKEKEVEYMKRKTKKHKTVLLADSPVGSITMCEDCETIHINIGFVSIKVHLCSFDELVDMLVCAKSMIEVMKNPGEAMKNPTERIAKTELIGEKNGKYIIYLKEETIGEHRSKEGENKEELEN